MSDARRIEELSELLFDGELGADEARELRAHLEAAPAAVAALRAAARDHLLCRTALRPGDPQVLAERTRLMLDSWRPSSRQVAAQNVLARVDRRRRWALARTWGGLAAAALVLVLLLPSLVAFLKRPALAPDERAPQLTQVNGDLHLDNGLALAAGDHLGIGSTLVSGPAGSATLAWSDGTRIAIAAGTRLGRLPGPGQHLRLESGTVTVRAAHRPQDRPLEIICPDATARVVGTAFSATVVDGRSRLAVASGLVRWQRASDGAWSLLGAGQQATAESLPLPRGILLPAEQIAALREAIGAGREPWAGSWKALQEQVPAWLAQEIPAPFAQEVSTYFPGNEQHSGARRALYRLVQPALALALAARVTGDEACGRRAIAWMRVIAQVGIYGPEAGTLGCDTLAVHGLQAADLLRGLPYWSAADEAAVDAWIARELTSRAQALRGSRSVTSRWRGHAALMLFAARRGDLQAVRALMAEVRADMPILLDREAVRRMEAQPDNHTLHQALNHALFCADVARIAAGDATPPPPEWGAAVAVLVGEVTADRNANGEALFFQRALSGPGPWRTPAARPLAGGPDPLRFNYGWLFPTLIAQDPRW
jgi:hypothetical protein